MVTRVHKNAAPSRGSYSTHETEIELHHPDCGYAVCPPQQRSSSSPSAAEHFHTCIGILVITTRATASTPPHLRRLSIPTPFTPRSYPHTTLHSLRTPLTRHPNKPRAGNTLPPHPPPPPPELRKTSNPLASFRRPLLQRPARNDTAASPLQLFTPRHRDSLTSARNEGSTWNYREVHGERKARRHRAGAELCAPVWTG